MIGHHPVRPVRDRFQSGIIRGKREKLSYENSHYVNIHKYPIINLK